GDGPGFTTGGTTITHQYSAAGTYAVTAHIFLPNNQSQTANKSVQVIVPDQASNPNPSNGATNVPVSTTLTWFAGTGATFSDVYLGTSSDAVNNATQASPECKGTVTTTLFTPANLLGSTVYFWRIDSNAGGNLTQGTVWSFTTITAPSPISNPSPADGA